MKESLKHLEHILQMGYRSYNIFDDWLDLMIFALMRDDDKYLEIVKKYNNDVSEIGKRPIDHFAKAFGQLINEMKESNKEMLGQIYMNWNIANKYTGQYFTPPHIARLMALITKPRGGTLSDPCCGSGIMFIETCKIMTNLQLNNSLFIGQDIDYTCVRMCALNLLFFNLNGYVILGNTLKVEYRNVYQTHRSIWGGSIRELSQEEVDNIKPRLIEIKQNKEDQQISFF